MKANHGEKCATNWWFELKTLHTSKNEVTFFSWNSDAWSSERQQDCTWFGFGVNRTFRFFVRFVLTNQAPHTRITLKRVDSKSILAADEILQPRFHACLSVIIIFITWTYPIKSHSRKVNYWSVCILHLHSAERKWAWSRKHKIIIATYYHPLLWREQISLYMNIFKCFSSPSVVTVRFLSTVWMNLHRIAVSVQKKKNVWWIFPEVGTHLSKSVIEMLMGRWAHFFHIFQTQIDYHICCLFLALLHPFNCFVSCRNRIEPSTVQVHLTKWICQFIRWYTVTSNKVIMNQPILSLTNAY